MARAVPVAGLLLVLCPSACALNPELDVSQYAHFSWKNRDGFARSEINDIAQTRDGYLWLSTSSGLLRFDGVKPVPWRPPPDQSGKDQPLPSSYITCLLATRDGTLWIGSKSGLASWKDGRLTRYAELAGLHITRLLENRGGSIWVGAYDLPKGKLCEIGKGNVRCDPEFHDVAAFGLHEDRNGNLWVSSSKGLWRWQPGSPKFYEMFEPTGILGIVDAEDGGVLISTTGGIRRLVGEKWELAIPLPASVRGPARNMLRDRDGALWIRTLSGGLVHVHQRRIDVFSQSDGLTGDSVSSIFEDREGNIWVSTFNGLDRFRELPVVAYSSSQGVQGVAAAVVAGTDGSIWFRATGLNRLNHGQLTIYGPRTASARTGVRENRGSGVSDHLPGSLFRDSRGRIWVAGREGVGYLENDRLVRTAAPGGLINVPTEDAAGNLWLPYPDRGLMRLSPDNAVQQFSWDTFGNNGPAIPLADSLHGGLWLGFRKGGLAYFLNGQIRASYSAAEGLAAGQVNHLRLDREGTLWIATEGGLSRLKDGRVITLTSKNGLPCDAALWSMEDDAQSVWLGMPCGLVRVARTELNAWGSSSGSGASASGHTIHPTVFDETDGARMFGGLGGLGPHVDKSPDGKLWFGTLDGVSVVDPRHLPFNKLSPPVHIEAVKINGKELAPDEGLKLSHSSNDLEIDYTALSFTNPQRVFFKYKLEGHDKDWQSVGTRRQAFYGGLKPKSYRFRVMACNNDVVWNEAGATWNFTITPAWYQTIWFQALCAVAFFAFLWALYRYRLYQVTREFNMRLDERVGERTRVARDLHDTLLQSFQGLLFQFQAARNLFDRRPDDAMRTLDNAIDSAVAAVAEGRDAIQNLRIGSDAGVDLADLLKAAGKELSDSEDSNRNAATFALTVEGSHRALSPVLQDELYRIGREILRNAFCHACAKQIEVEIRYNARLLRMQIRDDGIGIDPKVLEEGARPGHWGLPGVRERAKLVGAKLDFWSEQGAGTEVQVTVPAGIAYGSSRKGRAFRLFKAHAD